MIIAVLNLETTKQVSGSLRPSKCRNNVFDLKSVVEMLLFYLNGKKALSNNVDAENVSFACWVCLSLVRFRVQV